MTKRVFIAINLPENVKDEIHSLIERHIRPQFDIDLRFIPSDNWHITLAFLGNRSDDDIYSVTQNIKEAVKKFSVPKIKLEKIAYGPLREGRNQNMIWFVGDKDTNQRLQKIHNCFIDSYQSFTAHITVLRFGNIPNFPRILPIIAKDISIEFTAASIDLMESVRLPAGRQGSHSGPNYANLFSADFK